MESTHFVVNGSGFKMSQLYVEYKTYNLDTGQLLTYWINIRVFTRYAHVVYLYRVFCFIQMSLKKAKNRYLLSLGLKRKYSFSPK
jgi:hypothetical protein